MSTTLLPFLYQTRTLQRLSRVGVSTPAFRALIHSTSRVNAPKRTRLSKVKADDIPFELPEGYQYTPAEQSESLAHVEQDPETGLRSTITPSERDTFNRIFEEIAARKNARPAPAAPEAPPPADAPAPISFEEVSTFPPTPGTRDTDVDEFGPKIEEPNPNSIRNTINVIIQDAAEVHTNSRRQMQKPFDQLHPLGQTNAASEWEKALLRFPPSLREAAQMALGVIDADKEAQAAETPKILPDETMSDEQRVLAQIDLALDPLSKSVQNEALRREERSRVEGLMREAKTDFELWDVLEAEVFPMIKKLGLDEEADPTAPKRKRGRKRNTKFPMHIYGPLYPTYLLTALRLLDTHFARSSPLVQQLLPRIKELGLASYVLGVSTPFYNELIRILWNRHGDPTAVFNLLEEMRTAGLYCDEVTRGVVNSIEGFLGAVVQGRHGPFLRELTTLPEYEFAVMPRVRHWLTTINMHIFERKNELNM